MQLWQCHQLLCRFVAKCHLLRVSHQSCLLEKGNNEVKTSGCAQISWHLPTVEETLKISARKPSEDCATSHYSKRGPLVRNEFSRITHYAQEEKKKKKKKFLQLLEVSLLCAHIVTEGKVYLEFPYFLYWRQNSKE